MDIYKAASRKKLRFTSPYGVLTVEQLWDLDLKDLDALAVKLEQNVEKSSSKSFLTETTEDNKDAKLAFEVALDVLQTKVMYRDRAAAAAETRQKNQRIAELIQKKKDEELGDLSISELEALLAD